MKRFYVILAALACLALPALADYHYVSHSGSNTYPYTSWETAADSIGAAIGAASPFDTLYIAAGDYYEMVRMADADSCLTFIGAGIDSTHCWTDIDDLWLVSDQTVAQNIWFELNRPYRSCYGGWIGASIIARHCKFSAHGNSGGILAAGDSTIVADCEFYNVDEALNISYPRKLVFKNNYIRGPLYSVVILGDWFWGIIENNILIATGGAPFFQESSDYSDSTVFRNNYLDHMVQGFTAQAPLTCQVANNTIRDCESALLALYGQSDPGNTIYRNNALTESGYGIDAGLSPWTYGRLDIGYTGFWGNRYGNMNIVHWDHVDTIGNINAFPMYANPDSYDVHLQAFSPFIDAGDPSIFDVDGTRSDIGVFGGRGGTSYQYQDLPPRRPDSLSYRISGDSLILTWGINHEADFWRYIINRDTVPGFTPWAGNIVGEPDTNLFIDFNWDGAQDYYYRIGAYDYQGNLSPYSDELAVMLSGIRGQSGAEVPTVTAIETNYPNPFNSSTTIIYTVANLGPIPAQINIDIYDIQGRKIRRLLDGRQEVGRHMITWDSKDDGGFELSSGIYFARIMHWHVDYLSRSQKLLLVR